MDVTALLLDSWDRQTQIVDAVASLVTEENRHFKPTEDGWSLDHQLAHMHSVRKGWMGELAPALQESLATSWEEPWVKPISSLDQLKSNLKDSNSAVRQAVATALQQTEEKCGAYDNPVLYLQHMLWHDGWHIGLIVTAFRVNGQEIQEEWEEPNIWGHWRTETWEE